MRKDCLCSMVDFECGTTSMIVLAWIEPYFCAYSLHHMHNCWYYYIFKVARFDHCFTGFFITVNSWLYLLELSHIFVHILFITCTTAGITRYFKLQDLTVVLQGFFYCSEFKSTTHCYLSCLYRLVQGVRPDLIKRIKRVKSPFAWRVSVWSFLAEFDGPAPIVRGRKAEAGLSVTVSGQGWCNYAEVNWSRFGMRCVNTRAHTLAPWSCAHHYSSRADSWRDLD